MPTYHYALTGALERRKVRKQLDIMSTYHYVQNQGKLMMQSQKKAKNLNLANFLTISKSNTFKLQIFQKIRFHSKIEIHI